MNLTVEQLLEQVKQFLSTGQPNMAVLYMRKALVLLQQQRTAVPESWVDAFMRVVHAIADRIRDAAEPVMDCIERVAAFLTIEPDQSDFFLLGES